MPLEPLPETRDLLDGVSQYVDRDLLAEMVQQANRVEEVVPNLVGMSLAVLEDGLTFTLAATRGQLALLDAIQYALGGPCVDAALEGVIVLGGAGDEGLLDEERWAHFARAGAAHGVLSTLSLPLHADGAVIGGVNLYAATPNAFAGREEQIALILGAWAPGAVHNADLSFTTRDQARQAPRAFADRAVLEQATGIVVAAHAVDHERARQIIADAARRAGQDEVDLARALVRPYAGGPDGDMHGDDG